MAGSPKPQTQPDVSADAPVDPIVVPDVTTQPHPAASFEPGPGANVPEAGEGQLQDALPAISQAAQKVGGYKKLAEIAEALNENGPS